MLSLVIPKVLCVRRADAAEVACTPTSKAVSVAISRRKKTKGRQPSAEHESESPIVHYRQWESTVLAISCTQRFMRLVSLPLAKPSFMPRQFPRPKRFAEPDYNL